MFWHPDVAHAVEDVHQGAGYSNVVYVGAAPYCAKNAAYVDRQKFAFFRVESAPDFAAENYEVDYQGRVTADDLSEVGQQQMGVLDW